MAAYNNFVYQNTRDQYQNHTHTFEITGFEEFVAFTAEGESKHNIVLFYIFHLLGCALPYSCAVERNVSRYDVGILKRLTV